jgi:hypothetical protein
MAQGERHRVSRFKCVFISGEIVQGERAPLFEFYDGARRRLERPVHNHAFAPELRAIRTLEDRGRHIGTYALNCRGANQDWMRGRR